MIGELIAGVVLGSSLLGWVEPFEAIKLLAEIGIILLLFEVGLETDLQKLVLSLAHWQALPQGREAQIIGRFEKGAARVILQTQLGGERLLEVLEDDPLPRIY